MMLIFLFLWYSFVLLLFVIDQIQKAWQLGIKIRNQPVVASSGTGVGVWSVAAGSIAEEAGVKPSDVVTHVNNRPVKNLAEFKLAVAQVPLH